MWSTSLGQRCHQLCGQTTIAALFVPVRHHILAQRAQASHPASHLCWTRSEKLWPASEPLAVHHPKCSAPPSVCCVSQLPNEGHKLVCVTVQLLALLPHVLAILAKTVVSGSHSPSLLPGQLGCYAKSAKHHVDCALDASVCEPPVL